MAYQRPPAIAQVRALAVFLVEATVFALFGTVWLCIRSCWQVVLEGLGRHAASSIGTSRRSNEGIIDGEAYVYNGRVMHHRRYPVTHKFQYAARYAIVNLDRVPSWLREDMRANHMDANSAREKARTTGPV